MSSHTIIDDAPFGSIIAWSDRDAVEKRRFFVPFDESKCGRLDFAIVSDRRAVDGDSVRGGTS